MRRFLLLLALLLITSDGYAHELELGVGAVVTQTAYRKYDPEWLVFPMIDFENEYIYVRDFSLGVKLLHLKDLNEKPFMFFSVLGSYGTLEFDPQERSDRRMKELRARKNSIFAGARVDTVTSAGIFSLSATRDVRRHSGGYCGKGAYYLPLEGEVVEFVPSCGFYWADSSYNRYYYGISEAESQKSGFRSHKSGSGLTPFAGLTTYLPLGESWEIVWHNELEVLPRKVRRSPMISTSMKGSMTLALNYIF